MLIKNHEGNDMTLVIRNISRANMAVIACAFLAACAPSSERRSFGTVIDDQSSEVKALDVIFSRDEFSNKDHIKVEMHNGTLLLIGETQSESNKALATELTIAMKNVDNVINELAVMPPATAGELLDNTWMTSKVNAVLTTENPVEGFDATRIKVLSARDHIYLMGTISRADGEAVAEVVRNIGGVEKVIKVFDYID